MTVTNDFVPFGTGAGANVIAPSTWATLPARFTGVQAGTASSAQANTAWRQTSSITTAIAQFISDTLAQSVSDNGNIATLEAQFIAAIQTSVGSPSAASLWHFGHDTGPANVLQIVASPIITAYADGMTISTFPQFSNTVSNPTLSANGLAATVIVHADGTALNPGDISVNTAIVFEYDAIAAKFRIISASAVPQAALDHYGADVGTANAMLVSTVTPGVAAVTTGMQFVIKKGASGNTGAVTLNIVGTSAALTWGDGTPLSGIGPEWPAGADGEVVFDGNYKMLSTPTPLSFVVPGTPKPLLAPRTYFVDGSAGSDSNDGLAAGAGHAFATLPKVMSVILSLNMNGFAVTVNVANGTYGPVICPALNGAGTVSFIGNTTTPANVTVAATTGEAIYVQGTGYSFSGMTPTSAANGSAPHLGCGIRVGGASTCSISNMGFGACAFAHILSEFGGAVGMLGVATGNPSAFINIVGSAGAFMYVDGSGTISTGQTILTLTGSPTFSSAFAFATTNGSISLPFQSITGSATGSKFSASLNGVISTSGSGINYYPGNSAGTTTTGGQYL
jgi:hypothetical protein